MKTGIAAALFALALPLCAQAPVSAETEMLFYKAFYLEKGPRDFAQAMELYDAFLAKAPESKLAAEAAKQQFALLDRLGKSKERDAFREKYAKLLGNAASTRGDRPAAPADAAPGDRPQRGQGGPGGMGRMDPAARIAELEKELAKAKEDGDDAAVERLTAQIERMKQMGQRGAGQGGQRGQRGGMGIMGGKPLAEMNEEEMTQFKDGMERMAGFMDRMKQNMTEEQAKKLDDNMAALKKNLDAGKLEDAQKSLDALRESFPQRGRRGGGQGGGDAGGQGGGGQGGGRRGGGGGGNGGGGGGGGGN
ncbi:MAG: hypothetical protein H6838_19160 [Planctomycetes bacterium]|nr:hypothetical protein [Planctomycetota bacterium]